MKKLLFAIAAVGASVVGVQAQDNPAPAPTPAPTESAAALPAQDDKTKIKAEELPEAVKKSLEAAEYKGWLINTAYHVKSTDTYEVELKNGAETKSFKFDKEGKKID